jgi:hypothetical protein
MPGANVGGTLTTGSTASNGINPSNVCVIPSGRTQMRLTLTGCDASNTVKTQKRTTPGGAWVDQTTYTSNQSATAITVAAGEEWRLLTIAQQAIREIRYLLDAL